MGGSATNLGKGLYTHIKDYFLFVITKVEKLMYNTKQKTTTVLLAVGSKADTPDLLDYICRQILAGRQGLLKQYQLS